MLVGNPQPSSYPTWYVKGAGILAIVFFGLAGCDWTLKLFDDSPAITLDSEGITDESSLLKFGKIGWNEIERIEEKVLRSQRYIAVYHKDPSRFLKGYGLKSKLAQANYALVGTPITISAVSTTKRHTELLNLLQEQLEESNRTLSGTKDPESRAATTASPMSQELQ